MVSFIGRLFSVLIMFPLTRGGGGSSLILKSASGWKTMSCIVSSAHNIKNTPLAYSCNDPPLDKFMISINVPVIKEMGHVLRYCWHFINL